MDKRWTEGGQHVRSIGETESGWMDASVIVYQAILASCCLPVATSTDYSRQLPFAQQVGTYLYCWWQQCHAPLPPTKHHTPSPATSCRGTPAIKEYLEIKPQKVQAGNQGRTDQQGSSRLLNSDLEAEQGQSAVGQWNKFKLQLDGEAITSVILQSLWKQNRQKKHTYKAVEEKDKKGKKRGKKQQDKVSRPCTGRGSGWEYLSGVQRRLWWRQVSRCTNWMQQWLP